MKHLFLSSAIIIIFLFSACKKNNSPTSPAQLSNNSVYGKVKFLDGSSAGYAKVELKSSKSYLSTSTICDKSGNYIFSDLSSGDYLVSFVSTRNDINTSKVSAILTEGDSLERDITITYNMLDDYFSAHINKDVFFMKFLPEDAMIGNNYNLINYLSGFYRRDVNDSVTLSADIYKIPDTLDWYNPGVTLTSDYIRNNFKYLTEVIEEPVKNHNHEIRFKDDNIKIILSNPVNGFAFVKKGDDNKRLEIPCVDFQNNDFGLRIIYK